MSGAGDDLDRVLGAAHDWLAEGHGTAIATVVETWGSAPRRVGSHLVVRDDGLFEGSVSGGCVEGDVIANALEVIGEGGSRRLDYGVADATAWEVGLACGGRCRRAGACRPSLSVEFLARGRLIPVPQCASPSGSDQTGPRRGRGRNDP